MLLVFTSSCIFQIHAQKKKKFIDDCYLITNQEDTIKCQIKIKKYDALYSFDIKAKIDGKTKKYTPSKIKGFKLAEIRYSRETYECYTKSKVLTFGEKLCFMKIVYEDEKFGTVYQFDALEVMYTSSGSGTSDNSSAGEHLRHSQSNIDHVSFLYLKEPGSINPRQIEPLKLDLYFSDDVSQEILKKIKGINFITCSTDSGKRAAKLKAKEVSKQKNDD